jgi:hypothetical protein
MIYFFVKDQVLSGMQPGRLIYKVISCSDGETGIVRPLIKSHGYTILAEKDFPIPNHKAHDWKEFPRLNK